MSAWKRNRLFVVRAPQRITQRALADAAGVSQATYSNWETGWAEPDNKQKAALAKALGVTVADINPPAEAKAS